MTGQMLAVSSAAILHVNASAECVRAKNAAACLDAQVKPDVPKREDQL